MKFSFTACNTLSREVIAGLYGRSQRQENKQTPMSAAHCLALHGLLTLLSYRTQNHRGGIVHSDLGPPTSIINQGNGPQAWRQANLVGAFSQFRFPLPE